MGYDLLHWLGSRSRWVQYRRRGGKGTGAVCHARGTGALVFLVGCMCKRCAWEQCKTKRPDASGRGLHAGWTPVTRRTGVYRVPPPDGRSVRALYLLCMGYGRDTVSVQLNAWVAMVHTKGRDS